MYLIDMSVVENLIDDPGHVWLSPNRNFAVTLLDGQLYVIPGDFAEVKTNADLDAYIKRHFQ